MGEFEEEGPATASDAAGFEVVDQPKDADACLVVDVSNLAYRSLNAYSELTSKSRGGAPSGHVYGSIRLLLSTLTNELDPGRWCVCLCYDGDGAREARQKVLPTYKADREHRFNPCPDVRQTLSHFPGLHIMQQEREGDDAMVWITTRLAPRCRKVVVLTGDKDLWALKRYANVQVFSPNMKRYVVEQDCIDKYHVSDPALIPLMKAITGDSSDSIVGVDRIPKAKAAALITKYGATDVASFYEAFRLDNGATLSGKTSDKVVVARARLEANERVIQPWTDTFGPRSVTRTLKSPEIAVRMRTELLSWDCVGLAEMLPAVYGNNGTTK